MWDLDNFRNKSPKAGRRKNTETPSNWHVTIYQDQNLYSQSAGIDFYFTLSQIYHHWKWKYNSIKKLGKVVFTLLTQGGMPWPPCPHAVHSLAVSLYVSVRVKFWTILPQGSVRSLVPRENKTVHPKSKIVNGMTNGPRSYRSIMYGSDLWSVYMNRRMGNYPICV